MQVYENLLKVKFCKITSLLHFTNTLEAPMLADKKIKAVMLSKALHVNEKKSINYMFLIKKWVLRQLYKKKNILIELLASHYWYQSTLT